VSLGCDVHGGRHLCLYFCYDCDVPACSVCLLHEHGPYAPGGTGKAAAAAVGGGHRTVKLRDALAARRDALKTLLNAFGPRLDRLESRARRLSGSGATTQAVRLDEPPTARSTATSNHENVPLLRAQHNRQVSLDLSLAALNDVDFMCNYRMRHASIIAGFPTCIDCT